jgi:hypothetical protein
MKYMLIIGLYSSLHEGRFWSFEASKSFRHKHREPAHKPIIYSVAILVFIDQNRGMLHNEFSNT